MAGPTGVKLVAFDLDGTLVDSDEALIAPFLACGVVQSAIPPLGLLLEDACALVDITVADYIAAYDPSLVRPFPGVVELVDTTPAPADQHHISRNRLRTTTRPRPRTCGPANRKEPPPWRSSPPTSCSTRSRR